jgi:hypothetical protein
MQNPRTMMLIASVMGVLVGFFVVAQLNPLNNFYVFVGLFAMTGVGVANLVLLVVYAVYQWLKNYYANVERAQNAQTA